MTDEYSRFFPDAQGSGPAQDGYPGVQSGAQPVANPPWEPGAAAAHREPAAPSPSLQQQQPPDGWDSRQPAQPVPYQGAPPAQPPQGYGAPDYAGAPGYSAAQRPPSEQPGPGQRPYYAAPSAHQGQPDPFGAAGPDFFADPAGSRYVDSRVGVDADSLTSQADRLDLGRRRVLAPEKGWRRWIYLLTFKQWNLGPSPREQAYAKTIQTVRTRVTDYKIAVLSLKGGVGKTTVTATLGSTFATHRKGDRILAVDANPDFGNLASKVDRETNTTVKDVVVDPNLQRYGDIRKHTSQNFQGLEIIASEHDLAQSEQFTRAEYEQVLAVTQRFYDIIFTDCGTGLINGAMDGTLNSANALLVISSVTKDGARAASATLEWLKRHGYEHLTGNTVLVLNQNKNERLSKHNLDELYKHFKHKARAVHLIPYDAHLAEGDAIDLRMLKPKTVRAFLELAELLAAAFTTSTGGGRHVQGR